jgi:hypothetical protein
LSAIIPYLLVMAYRALAIEIPTPIKSQFWNL